MSYEKQKQGNKNFLFFRLILTTWMTFPAWAVGHQTNFLLHLRGGSASKQELQNVP